MGFLVYHKLMQNIKILLIEPSVPIGEVIVKSLQRTFNAEVIFLQTVAHGIQKIKESENFSLIIARNEAHDSEGRRIAIAGPFFNIVYDMSLNIPILVIGEFEHTYKKFAIVSERLRIEEINRQVMKLLNLKKEDFDYLKLPEYVAFSVKNFYLMTTSPCSVYIKLAKKKGDEFVKRLNYGDSFSKEDLLRYEELGLSEFYINRSEYEDFMNGLFIQALSNLKKARTLAESLEVLGDSFVISTGIMVELGITPGCLAMVDQTIHMIKSQIQQTDKLGLLMMKLLHNKLTYSYRHSYLICALSYTLLPRMEWGSGDQQNILMEKICMVSYFHDIYLQDDNLVKVSDTESLRKGKFTSREIDLLNNHANRAAVLIQTYPKLPQGVDLIIKQHHGVPNGVGFAEVLTTSISPMAIFFMVVEDFATNILGIEEARENIVSAMREAVKPLKVKYQMPSYRKIVTEIEALMAPKK
jgi:HD-GYP domain-containing protein (c-di-GMP phosphodiesterase class II)